MAEDPLSPSRLRVFLAIPLYEIFHHEIDFILDPLRHKIPGVAWARPEQIHLTLHFFGSTPAADINRMDASLSKIASNFSPLRLRLSGIGGFPGLNHPDILWIGVEEKSGKLSSLKKAIGREVKMLGFKVESRPFQPHATIGRIKKRTHDLEPLCRNIPEKILVAKKTADHFVLYQSHCLPEGSRYEVLKTYPLSKKA